MRDFCSKYNLYTDYEAFQQELASFVEDMKDGLTGAPSTQKMIPTYLSLEEIASCAGEKAIVIDAGGTNLRIGLAQFDQLGKPVITDIQVYPMLGVAQELTIDQFFDQLADYLAPYLPKSDRIGFCFSFPCQVLPNMDGRILHFNKEVKVSGATGVLLAEGLRAAFKSKGLPCSQRIVVINDTVATLLGGKADVGERVFDSYIGYILGTGTNTCYAEQNSLITKDSHLCAKAGCSLINMESGGYGRMQRNAVEETFDSTTTAPGAQLLEKMISGAYQGGMLLAYLKQAAAEGCFLPATAEAIGHLTGLESKEIDAFCNEPYGTGRLAALSDSETEKQKIYQLMDGFFDRAAMMTVVNLAGVMVKTGTGKSPLKPVCITAEGSTFYKSKLLHSKIQYLMVAYLQKRLGIYAEFRSVDRVTLAGTALAAMVGEN